MSQTSKTSTFTDIIITGISVYIDYSIKAGKKKNWLKRAQTETSIEKANLSTEKTFSQRERERERDRD